MVSELESDLWDTVDWYRKWLIGFIAGKPQLTSFDQYNNTGAIDMKRNGSVLKETLCFNMLGLTFSSKLDRDSYIISINKNASKKTGALICSIKLLSPEVTLCHCKSTIWPCMKYWNHVWAGAPICYFESLNKLLKRIYRSVGSSRAISLEPFAHRRNVASFILFYKYYSGRRSSELAQLVQFPYSQRMSNFNSDRLHDHHS